MLNHSPCNVSGQDLWIADSPMLADESLGEVPKSDTINFPEVARTMPCRRVNLTHVLIGECLYQTFYRTDN